MNPETQKMLQGMADKLGVTVQYLWAVLVRGNRVEGAILFGFVGLGVVVGIFSFFIFREGFKVLKKNNYDAEPYLWFGGFAAGVSALLIICFSYWAVMGTFCPEYG